MSVARIVLMALFMCAVAVSGCSDGDGDGGGSNAPASSSTETSASATASTAAGESSTSAAEQSGVPEPVVPPAQVTFECGDPTLYQSGTALYSDGTTGYEPSCDVAPSERTLQYCDVGGVAVYSDGSYSTTDPACALPPPPSADESGYPYDPSQDRNGDGVISGYERCGTACGEAPTSGEIQMQYGCEEGWIDPETCTQAGY